MELTDIAVPDKVPKKPEKIPGGYYILARKIEESEIAHRSPCVRELWHWLIRQANHKDNCVAKRGQCVRTISDMQEGLSWYVGYRKETYSKGQCEAALETLRKSEMIETAKTTRGLRITVCNYERYQDFRNYEPNDEPNKNRTRTEQSRSTINNERLSNDNIDSNSSKSSSNSKDRIAPDGAANLQLIYKGIAADKNKVKEFISTYRPNFPEPYANYWNRFAEAKGLPKVEHMNPNRRAKVKTRCKEKSFDFVKIILAASKTDFDLTSKFLTFDWIMDSPHNYVKLLEGNYKSKNVAVEKDDYLEQRKRDLERLKEKIS